MGEESFSLQKSQRMASTPGDRTPIYIGLVFGGVQSVCAIWNFPLEFKIPALFALVFGCVSLLFYFQSGLNSTAVRLSLSGTLVAIAIGALFPAASRMIGNGVSSNEAEVFYLMVSIFNDANENGLREPLEQPLAHILVRIYQRDRLDNQGIYPKETDQLGVAQLTVPRPGKSIIRVCGLNQQIMVNADATVPARTQQFSISVPPYLINRCEKS